MLSESLILNPYSYKNHLGLDLEDIVNYEKACLYLQQFDIKVEKLVVSDFDETLFSRQEQLSESRFENNRGMAGNDLVENVIGLTNFFEKYYNKEMVVSDISEKTNIILTAGREVLQRGKIEHTGLDALENIIVPEHKYKPRALLDYLIKNKLYPEILEINDDKAFVLLEGFKQVSKLLGNTIILNQVQLSPDRPNEIDNQETIRIEKGKIIPEKKTLH